MRKRAFTLIELLIVLLILGVLTGIAVPRYMESTKTAKRVTFETNLQDIVKALEDYKIQHQFENTLYPTSLEQLQSSNMFNKEPVNPYTGKSMLSSNSEESGLQYQATGGKYKLCVVQRDIEDVNDNGIVDEVLPLITKNTCIGDTTSNVVPVFKRNSVAYTSDGAQVAANQPRFEQGQFGKAIMMEDGTTNAIPHTSDGKFGRSSDGEVFAAYVWDRKDYTNDIEEWITDSSVPSPALYVKRITPYPANGGSAYAVVGELLVGEVMPGEKYTISLWFKGNKQSSSIIARVRFSWRNSNNETIERITLPIPFTDNWQRHVFTVTAPDGAYKLTSFEVGLDNINLNNTYEFYIAGLQLEQKAYATSFIDSTRAAETLTIPTAGVLNPQEGTIEFWVKPLIVGNYNNFFHMPGLSNGRFLLFFCSSGSWANFDYGPNNTGPITPAGTIMANNWYHIVLRWSATTGKQALFVNGVKYEKNLPNGVASSFPSTVSIVNNYSAYIDDLRISSRARSDEEIAAAYASGQPLPVDAWTTLKLDFNGDLSTQSGVIP